MQTNPVIQKGEIRQNYIFLGLKAGLLGLQHVQIPNQAWLIAGLSQLLGGPGLFLEFLQPLPSLQMLFSCQKGLFDFGEGR